MPTGKPIAECLQGLDLLAQGPKPTKSQWTALAKTIHGHITKLIASIDEEDRADGHAKSLNERIKDRTSEWVDKYSDLWTLKNRGSLFPHAPLYPAEKLVMAFWVEQLVQNKLDRANSNTKQSGAKSLPDGIFHDDNRSQGPISRTQDIEETSEANDETNECAASPVNSSHDEEVTGFNQSPAPHVLPAIPVAVSILKSAPTLQASDFDAVISYRSPEHRPTQTGNPFQRPRPGFSPQNFFTSLAYPPIAFPQPMFSRIIFLILPSGDHSRSAGRIMGLAEAQNFVNFQAGTLERLKDIGERIGTRRLVTKLELLPVPVLVRTSHDHHFLLEAVKTWAEWQSPGLCVVCISLEDEA